MLTAYNSDKFLSPFTFRLSSYPYIILRGCNITIKFAYGTIICSLFMAHFVHGLYETM